MAIKIMYKNERIYFILASFLSLLMYAGLCAYFSNKNNVTGFVSMIIFSLIFRWIVSLYFRGFLEGNAIQIGPQQYPEIFDIVKQHAKKLELKTVPKTYILQGNGVINVFAAKLAGKHAIILYSNILHATYQEGFDAISFIIGHELGHIKLGHVSTFCSFLITPIMFIPLIGHAFSRLREYNCDNIGYQLCPEHGALKGLLILSCGPVLYKNANLQAIKKWNLQSQFAVKIVELFSMHPAIKNRIASVNSWIAEDFMNKEKICAIPNVDICVRHKQL